MTPGVDLTAIIVTYNEARNLPACLATLIGWVPKIIVVDSGSTDETVAIARAAGVTVIEHPLDTHPAQWNWIFTSVPVTSAWTLALDADHRVTSALRDAISTALSMAPLDVAGYYVTRQLIFRGHRLRWGGCTRPTLKLFRTGLARCDEAEAPDHRFYIAGRVGVLHAPLLEDNRNEGDLGAWIAKQHARARMQALAEWHARTRPRTWLIRPALWGSPDQRILWWKQQWSRMPRYVRPCLYFLYRYLVLGGCLDGWPGLQFHSVQGFWLRWQADVEMDRLKRANA